MSPPWDGRVFEAGVAGGGRQPPLGGVGHLGVGGDEGDAELFQGAAELGGLTFSGELLFHRPAVVVADEDATVIAIKSHGHAEAAQQLAKQAEIAESGLRGEEPSGQDFAGGVVLHTESGEPRTTAFEPVVWAAVKLHEFAEPSGTCAALAMSASTAFSRRAEPVLAQQSAQGFATERKAFTLHHLLAEMVVVEAGVGAARGLDDPLAHSIRQATRAR